MPAPPEPPRAPTGALRHDPVAFAGDLRAAGVDVPVSSTVMWVAALNELGATRPDDVYWAGRATLVRRREDVAAYDRCFARRWLGVEPPPGAVEVPPLVTVAYDTAANDPADADRGDDRGEGDDAEVSVRWSRVEVLRHKDLATCTPEELEELWAVLGALRLGGPRRRSRRRVRGDGVRARIDRRATLRASLRTAGDVLAPVHAVPAMRLRRVVLLLDVSGSMEDYARVLLRFAHAATASRRPVEVFAFGTRLTRLTRLLDSHDPDAALRHATAAVVDFGGGTRIGDALEEFNRTWGVRGLARGAEVVVLSDGWDRGEPAVVAEQMARLSRVAHRVIWVNPLKAGEGYAPLARGMAAALPHVDLFVEGHSLASLEALASLLADS